MLSIFLSSLDRAQTMQSATDSVSSLKLLLIILFIFFILLGIFHLITYLLIKHSPDLSLNFLFPRLPLGKKNVSFNIENDLGRPLRFTLLTIFRNEKIVKRNYFVSNFYKVYLPKGKYQATICKFGHLAASTDTFEIKDSDVFFELTLKRAQDIKPAKHIFKLIKTLMIINVVFALVSLIFISINFDLLTLPLQIILLGLAGFSLYLAYTEHKINKAIKLVNFKNQPLKNSVVEFANKKNELLEKFKTDNEGLLHLMISPGIYKLTPENYTHRSIRVLGSGPGRFKIKF